MPDQILKGVTSNIVTGTKVKWPLVGGVTFQYLHFRLTNPDSESWSVEMEGAKIEGTLRENEPATVTVKGRDTQRGIVIASQIVDDTGQIIKPVWGWLTLLGCLGRIVFSVLLIAVVGFILYNAYIMFFGGGPF